MHRKIAFYSLTHSELHTSCKLHNCSQENGINGTFNIFRFVIIAHEHNHFTSNIKLTSLSALSSARSAAKESEALHVESGRPITARVHFIRSCAAPPESVGYEESLQSILIQPIVLRHLKSHVSEITLLRHQVTGRIYVTQTVAVQFVAGFRKATVIFVICVCPSVCPHGSASTGQI